MIFFTVYIINKLLGLYKGISDQHYSKYLQYLSSLLREETLADEALDHPLKEDLKSFREFHISGDFLIIYIIQDDTQKLVRIGTNSQRLE